MEIQNLILWGIALIVTVVIGLWGRQVVKSYKSQNQRISGGSVGIQSGKDTKINDDQ